MEKTKMTKNTIPENFTVGLALFDMVPVLLFAGACVLLFFICNHDFGAIIGGFICFVAGLIKVIWKIIVATKKKNIWWMFVQMRIALPIGFALVLLTYIITAIDESAARLAFVNVGSIIFLVLAVIGMAAMIVCSAKLDSADKKSNWIEEGCNTFAQLSLFLACLFAYLH